VCRVAARAERVRSVPRLIRPDEMHHELRGANHWQRGIIDVVDQDFPADRIIIVEVMTPPGHWSSFPPHRHEVDDPPGEVDMEEIYYYRTDNPAGFGLQAVYTDDRTIDDAYIVRDHDVLVIPRGYHPVTAAPSSSLWYLCVLAGDRRLMAPRDEPENAWFRVAERLLA
jgi:5-deoxy-glucuronate isomerase